VAADHFAHFDLAGRPRQHHAAARAADRAHKSGLGEVLDDLVQVVARNDEFARERIGADMGIGRRRQPHEHAQGKVG
jgi:hypothetical protein